MHLQYLEKIPLCAFWTPISTFHQTAMHQPVSSNQDVETIIFINLFENICVTIMASSLVVRKQVVVALPITIFATLARLHFFPYPVPLFVKCCSLSHCRGSLESGSVKTAEKRDWGYLLTLSYSLRSPPNTYGHQIQGIAYLQFADVRFGEI